jgi:peptidyl-prolyl cis-trans isomerase A (cyclophilin A)
MTANAELLQPGTMKEQAPAEYDVSMSTTKGDIMIHVTRAWAPLGADRFYNLVKNGFYTDASFFRVLPGFVVQFGLSADPKVSGVWRSANFKDDPVTQSNKSGSVTFATAGKDTRTTQVFINLGNNANLDSMGFAPFGQVTEGMDVVKKLHSGYGEGAPSGRGPDQGAISSQGKAYLDKSFPNLDSIKTATVAASGK